MTSLRSALVGIGAPVAAKPGTAIPFRQDAAISFPEAGSILAVTLLLLVVFYGLVWYAKRAGWLDRWVSRRAASSDDVKKLAILERLVVSRKTVIYRIRDGGQEYLLVESSVSAGLTASERRA